MPKTYDLTGQKFGRLTVLKCTGQDKHHDNTFLCKCDCGNEKIVAGYRLKNGHTQSCGCYNREVTSEYFTKHGLSTEPLYFVWKAMIARCENPENPNYFRYGERGISVCDEWHDVETFYKWALEGYEEGLEIDRVNNDGGYSPDNCKWSTRSEQLRNTRRNVLVELNGVTKPLIDWANEYGLKVNTIQYRYYRGDRGEYLFRPIRKECNWRLKHA